jgi:hypothetical protein
MRCGFGALRVGALLGRLRLHMQTERFLAAYRGDALWEAGCVGAALALADVAARLRPSELDASLRQRPGDEDGSRSREGGDNTPGEELWGARKSGTATLARCTADLERSTR